MLKERLYFLKRNLLLAIFLTILALFLGEGPLSDVIPATSNLSVYFYCFFIGLYWACVFIGFFRFKFDYFGRALLLLYFTLSGFSYIALILIGPRYTHGEIKVNFPFNYIGLLLFFISALYLFYYCIKKLQKLNQAEPLEDMLNDVNSKEKIYYADLGERKNRTLDPKKQKISIWLTVITQVILLKMTWSSSAGQSLLFVSIGLVSLVCLAISMEFFMIFSRLSKLEKIAGVPLKPALRNSFSLKQWIIDGQKNSY